MYLRNKLFSLRWRTFYNVRVEVFAAEILMIADTCSLFRLVQHDWTCFGSYTKWDRRSVSLCVDSESLDMFENLSILSSAYVM